MEEESHKIQLTREKTNMPKNPATVSDQSSVELKELG